MVCKGKEGVSLNCANFLDLTHAGVDQFLRFLRFSNTLAEQTARIIETAKTLQPIGLIHGSIQPKPLKKDQKI
jgi:hypothetical protein